MKMTELRIKYDKYLELNYQSKDMIKSYKSCFDKFAKSHSRIYRLTNDNLKDYFIGFQKEYSISYYNQMLSSVRIIFKLLNQERKLKGVIYKKDSLKQTDILSLEELKTSLNKIDNLKHKCIVNLLYIGALRISELLNVKLEDIDSKNNRIIITKGKGGNSRYIPIGNADIEELRNYYRQYKPDVYLFESRIKGKKYSQTSIRKVVKKLGERVYPHLLRHTSLTNLIDNKHNILKVQLFAGHSNSKSTQRYYHNSKKALNNMTLSLK